MTNMGLKIAGDEMEVGFTVFSREEFDVAVARLTTVATMLWSQTPEVEQSSAVVAANPASGNYAEERRAANWREAQGLR